MTQVIVNLGTGGSDLNGRSGSTTGADSNDPKFLPWEGENYVYLPGVSGNYLSVPDEAALDITGDIDIRVECSLESLTSNQVLIGKAVTGTQISYAIFLVSGVPRLYWSETGSAFINSAATANLTTVVSNGERFWLRATLDVDNGASQNEVKFFTSNDGSTYTQLGSTVTTAGTTSIFNSTSEVRLGNAPALTSSMAQGNVHRTIVKDGIDGTTVLDVDTSLVSSGSDTSFTARTGQTVTINRSTSGRKSVAVVSPVWLFGTDDYMEVADNALLDFGASDSFTVLAVVRQWATPPNVGRYIEKRPSGSAQGWTSYYLQSTSELGVTLNDGTSSATEEQALSLGEVNALGMIVDETSDTLAPFVNGTVGSTVSTSSLGSLANSGPMRIGRAILGAAAYNDMEFIAAAVFRRALTAGEIATLNTYFQGRVA